MRDACFESGIVNVAAAEISENGEDMFDCLKEFASAADAEDMILIFLKPLPAITAGTIRSITEKGDSVAVEDPTDGEVSLIFAPAEALARNPAVCIEVLDRVSINDAEAAALSEKTVGKITANIKSRINAALSDRGVIITDAESVCISPEAEIAAGAVIMPGSIIKGASVIRAGAVIGPNTVLENAVIGRGTSVNSSQILKSSVGEDTKIGPFAYIRPDCVIGNNVKIGDFVELKNAHVGDGTKISHLTYVGDARVGKRVNFGCGTVTVNYDGRKKSITTIEDDAFIGCNTNLVAPVTIKRGAYTAAGSTITFDVPEDSLVIARAREVVKEGWAAKKRENEDKE